METLSCCFKARCPSLFLSLSSLLSLWRCLCFLWSLSFFLSLSLCFLCFLFWSLESSFDFAPALGIPFSACKHHSIWQDHMLQNSQHKNGTFILKFKRLSLSSLRQLQRKDKILTHVIHQNSEQALSNTSPHSPSPR